MPTLDAMDIKILRILSKDARTPYSHIAKELNLSDVAVKKRVERLFERGIIHGFIVDIDLKKIGYEYVVFFEIKPDPALANTVYSRILEIPNVLEAHLVVGDYQILAKAVAASVAEIKRLSDQIGRMDGVLEMKTSVSLEGKSKPLQLTDSIGQRALGGK